MMAVAIDGPPPPAPELELLEALEELDELALEEVAPLEDALEVAAAAAPFGASEEHPPRAIATTSNDVRSQERIHACSSNFAARAR
jgi:hypothetical protein